MIQNEKLIIKSSEITSKSNQQMMTIVQRVNNLKAMP